MFNIKNIRLKISNFFRKESLATVPPVSDMPLNGVLSPVKQKIAAEAKSFEAELDILRQLSGIGALRKETSMEAAYQTLLKEETQNEYNRLLGSNKALTKLRVNAAEQAAIKIERDEGALAMANAMEGRRRKFVAEKETFDDKWSKYTKWHIKKRDPKAKDFAKFLIKFDYVDDEQLDEIAVSAIFVDNEIINFDEFRIELKRVNALEAA